MSYDYLRNYDNVSINFGEVTAKSLTPVLQKVSATLIKFLAGEEPTNCLKHSLLGQDLLRRCGIEASVVVGWSAWKVSDADYVATHPFLCDVNSNPEEIFHAWLLLSGRFILDFTLYQLMKRIELGKKVYSGQMKVSWDNPDYLLVAQDKLVNFRDIVQSRCRVGACFYQRCRWLEARVLADALPLPESAFEKVWRVYQNL
jgi:hypothetical protein